MPAWTVALPNSPETLLLWSQSVCIWALALYANYDPSSPEEVSRIWNRSAQRRRWIIALLVRAFTAALLVFVISRGGQQRYGAAALSFVVFLSIILIPVVRNRLIHSAVGARWLVEWEIGALVGTNLLIAIVIGHQNLELSASLATIPFSAHEIARASLLVATYATAMKFGTFAVRGMVARVQVLPSRQTELIPQLTTELEMNRGRLIGNLERVLIVTLVIMGRFEALGFLVAAKGLIRIKKFEQQDFAEYFLVGTLTSVIVAVFFGLAYVKGDELLRLHNPVV